MLKDPKVPIANETGQISAANANPSEPIKNSQAAIDYKELRESTHDITTKIAYLLGIR